MGGHTFEMTLTGVRAIEDEAEDVQIFPANPDMFRDPDQTQGAPASALIAPKRRVAPAKRVDRPLNVVKAAQARRRELIREIARLKKLECELAELDRLLAAAENKPRAIVRDIAAKRG